MKNVNGTHFSHGSDVKLNALRAHLCLWQTINGGRQAALDGVTPDDGGVEMGGYGADWKGRSSSCFFFASSPQGPAGLKGGEGPQGPPGPVVSKLLPEIEAPLVEQKHTSSPTLLDILWHFIFDLCYLLTRRLAPGIWCFSGKYLKGVTVTSAGQEKAFKKKLFG